MGIMLLSFLGFVNALFLYWQHVLWRTRGRSMFCLIGKGCSDVVGSKYGNTFGINNELVGMAYYLTVISLEFFGGTVLGFRPLPLLSGAAMGFSLYLLYLQLVVLRKFCFWCMVAIMINSLIFFLTV